MQQPSLILIAGCNGSGKSTYSSSLVPEGVLPFDYDLLQMQNYEKLPDSEFREEFAKNQTTQQLEELISTSLRNHESCCFETNLMNVPVTWLTQFKNSGFQIEIYFFCLDTLEKAKERVMIRTKNNGHFVPDEIIEIKWKEGYKNINSHFSAFDRIVFIDNSNEQSIPIWLFELTRKNEQTYEIVQFVEDLPEYTQRRLPAIFNLLH